MTVTYKTEEEKERVILVAVDVEDGTDVENSLNELNELAETAGAVAVGSLIQKRESVHAGTYIGKGKITDLKEMAEQNQADAIVCDDELSPAQITNLQEMLQKGLHTKVGKG